VKTEEEGGEEDSRSDICHSRRGKGGRSSIRAFLIAASRSIPVHQAWVTTNRMRGWSFGPIQWNGTLGWIELEAFGA